MEVLNFHLDRVVLFLLNLIIVYIICMVCVCVVHMFLWCACLYGARVFMVHVGMVYMCV